MTLSISDKSGNRETPITLVGKGFKNETMVTVYLDRTRDSDGQIINMPDGVWTPRHRRGAGAGVGEWSEGIFHSQFRSAGAPVRS